MRILGIESSSMVASAAIVQDSLVMAEYTLNFKKTHSQTLLPMINELVKMTGISLDSIDAVAVSGGPGSFTGLRIGAATGKGLGLALNKPLIHVPTLDAMAFQSFGTDRVICPIMDARRNRVYTGIYTFDGNSLSCLMKSDVLEVVGLMDKLNEINQPVLLLGDGVEMYSDEIKRLAFTDILFAGPCSNRPRGGAVAALGEKMFEHNQIVSPDEFAPDYLRKSQAEQEREAKGLSVGE